jgi:hypothetical protein
MVTAVVFAGQPGATPQPLGMLTPRRRGPLEQGTPPLVEHYVG